MRFDYKYYAHDTHGSVPLIAEYDGFRFMFDYYNRSHNQLLLNDKSTAKELISLGDLYDATGDHQKAADAYRKALTLYDNADTRKKLDEQLAKIK